jgi:hypothetical protein
MPEGGGMLAMNYLYNTAAKDGTVIGVVQSNTPIEPQMGARVAGYDALKFNWLGTSNIEVAVVWCGTPCR